MPNAIFQVKAQEDLRVPLCVTVNGESRLCPEGTTLEGLLVTARIPLEERTVFLNGRRIPKGEHGKTELHDGDKVDVVRWISGG